MRKTYIIRATVKRLSDSHVFDMEEEFLTEEASICFVKNLSSSKYWNGDRNLVIVGKPVIIC